MTEQESGYPLNIVKQKFDSLSADYDGLRHLILMGAERAEATRLEFIQKMAEIAESLKKISDFSQKIKYMEEENSRRWRQQELFSEQEKKLVVAVEEIKKQLAEIVLLKRTIYYQKISIFVNSFILFILMIFIVMHTFMG